MLHSGSSCPEIYNASILLLVFHVELVTHTSVGGTSDLRRYASFRCGCLVDYLQGESFWLTDMSKDEFVSLLIKIGSSVSDRGYYFSFISSAPASRYSQRCSLAYSTNGNIKSCLRQVLMNLEKVSRIFLQRSIFVICTSITETVGTVADRNFRHSLRTV